MSDRASQDEPRRRLDRVDRVLLVLVLVLAGVALLLRLLPADPGAGSAETPPAPEPTDSTERPVEVLSEHLLMRESTPVEPSEPEVESRTAVAGDTPDESEAAPTRSERPEASEPPPVSERAQDVPDSDAMVSPKSELEPGELGEPDAGPRPETRMSQPPTETEGSDESAMELSRSELPPDRLREAADRILRDAETWPTLAAPFGMEEVAELMRHTSGWLVAFDPTGTHPEQELVGGVDPSRLRPLSAEASRAFLMFPICEPPQRLLTFVRRRWPGSSDHIELGWLISRADSARLLAVVALALEELGVEPEETVRVRGGWGFLNGSLQFLPERVELEDGSEKPVRLRGMGPTRDSSIPCGGQASIPS